MSDATNISDESQESLSNQNENSPSKRVFVLSSEMVKQLGLDEKIKIFKDKVKVDADVKPMSVGQVDKDMTQLIVRESSNGEINSDVQNKSGLNGEGSNIKDAESKVSVNSENGKDVEKKDKEVCKKSITHHVETLQKPFILRRTPTTNGIVVLNTQNADNENQKVFSVNKLKVIGDQKTVVIKPLGMKKSEELVPEKEVRTLTNAKTDAVNNKTNTNNDAANNRDDIVVDAIKSNKNNSLHAFKRPFTAYHRANDLKAVQTLNANSKKLPGAKIIKLSTIKSNASRDAILNSKDLIEQPVEEFEKALQSVNVQLEEVSSKDPKNKISSPSEKKKRRPPRKKNVEVIEILDNDDKQQNKDGFTSSKKRGRPRKFMTKESLEKLQLLSEQMKNKDSNNSEDQSLNKKLEDLNSNKESEDCIIHEKSESQDSNNPLKDSYSNKNFKIPKLKKETEASSISEDSEILKDNKKLKLLNSNDEVRNVNINGELENSNSNKSSKIVNSAETVELSISHKKLTDDKVALDEQKSADNNSENNVIKSSTKAENHSENAKHMKEEVENNTVETHVKAPAVRKSRGRPRKSSLMPSTPIEEEAVPNHADDTVQNNTSNNTDAGNDTNNNADNNDNGDNAGDDDDDDDDDNDDEDESNTRNRGRRGKRGRKKPGWYIKPDSEKTSNSAKKKENKNEEIQCAKCNEKMLKSKWNTHNLSKHNNTGWLSGNKDPDFEKNDKLWKKVLGEAIKKKKGILVCDKCNDQKRSVSGFISHYTFCGKSEEERIAMMWICPTCSGIFMPSSMDFHLRTHRQETKKAPKKPVEIVINDETNCRKRRRAAEKATNKILEFTKIVKDEPPAKKSKRVQTKINDLIEKPVTAKKLPNVWKGQWSKDIAANRPARCRQPNCTFSATNLDEICDHFYQCNFTPQTEYICKICRFYSKTKDVAESHVKSVHSDELNTGEDSDFSANELSDAGAESDNNNYEEFEEEEENPRNTKKLDMRRCRPRHCDSYNASYMRAHFLRSADFLQFNAINTTYTPTIKWSMQFELDNYQLNVFENLLPNYFKLLTNSQAQDYLPELKVSMKTKQMKNTSQNFEFVKIKIIKEENLTEEEKRNKGWKSFKLFESAVINNVPTFFVGGPIWSLAWLPIPAPMYSHKINQYLAVSTHPKMETKCTVGKSYKFKNIIQIWNTGHLDHSKASTPTPELSYIITHNNGTIWCMEWCPSGSYHHPLLNNDIMFKGKSLKRMGLLATASSDGFVHIYSLPFPEELNFTKTDDNDLPVYQTSPVVTLHINRLLSLQNNTNIQCTSLSWSKLSGHNIIAAGFSNGFVALWDLTSKSPLLVAKSVNTIHINAFQHFSAHMHAVTHVGIVPVSGKTFLSTASLDRNTKVWDLEDHMYPLSCVNKTAATNGAWMTHWINNYTCYDDGFSKGHTVSYMMGARDHSSGTFPLLPTNSTTYGLAVSDYANGICHGTLAGDICAIFPFQMLYIKDIDKLTKKRWLVSSVELVDFGENTEGENNLEANNKDNDQSDDSYKYMPDTYDGCKDRFGIVYHDDLNNWKSNLVKKTNRRNPVNSDSMNTVQIEQYPFTSVNRLAWNQNSWSYLWVAAGYQNGLIRILNLKSMSVENVVMKLLPGHAKSMMHKFDNSQASSES